MFCSSKFFPGVAVWSGLGTVESLQLKYGWSIADNPQTLFSSHTHLGFAGTRSMESQRSYRIKYKQLALQVWFPFCVKHDFQCGLTPEPWWFSARVLQEESFLLISFRSRLLPIHTTTYLISNSCLKNQLKRLPFWYMQPVQHCTLSTQQRLHKIVNYMLGAWPAPLLQVL